MSFPYIYIERSLEKILNFEGGREESLRDRLGAKDGKRRNFVLASRLVKGGPSLLVWTHIKYIGISANQV
jgi:hypothetical protein